MELGWRRLEWKMLGLMSCAAWTISAVAQTSHPKTPGPGAEGEQPVSFEKCTDSNSYLQIPLQKYLKQSSLPPTNQAGAASLQPCIHRVMYRPAGTQLVCGKATDSRKSATQQGSPPCASRELVGHLADMLVYVGRCAGVDPRELFPIWAHESSFSPIAVSPSGAGGIAQLTGPAVGEVNEKLPRMEKMGIPVASEACQEFKSYLTPMEPKDYTCARLVMPPNPFKNMVFGAIYFRMMQENAKRKFNTTRWQTLTEPYRSFVIREFARAMYNGGQGVVGAKIDSFLASNPDAPRDLSRFREEFRQHLGVDTEFGQYSGKIDRELNQLTQSPKRGVAGLNPDQINSCGVGAEL